MVAFPISPILECYSVFAARCYDSFGTNPAMLSEWLIASGVEGVAPWRYGASQGLFLDGSLWRNTRVSILSMLQEYLKNS